MKPKRRRGRPGSTLTPFGRWMDRQGLTAAEICAKTGLGRNTVSRLRNGTGTVSGLAASVLYVAYAFKGIEKVLPKRPPVPLKFKRGFKSLGRV